MPAYPSSNGNGGQYAAGACGDCGASGRWGQGGTGHALYHITPYSNTAKHHIYYQRIAHQTLRMAGLVYGGAVDSGHCSA